MSKSLMQFYKNISLEISNKKQYMISCTAFVLYLEIKF